MLTSLHFECLGEATNAHQTISEMKVGGRSKKAQRACLWKIMLQSDHLSLKLLGRCGIQDERCITPSNKLCADLDTVACKV